MGIEKLDDPANITQFLGNKCITNLMYMIWQSRPDLERAFDLNTAKGQQGFCQWYDVSVLREYGLEPQTQENQKPTSAIAKLLQDRDITNLMYMIWQSRSDLREAFDLNTADGQRDFCQWCDVSVLREYGIELQISEKLKGSGNVQMLRKLISAKLGGVYNWLRRQERIVSRVGRCLPQPLLKLGKSVWYYVLTVTARLAARNTDQQLPIDIPPSLPHTHGVLGVPGANLIGYAHAELGMGEHVRMTAAALATTDVKCGVLNFDVGVASRQKAVLEHGELAENNIYCANLFHINADAMLLAYCHFGKRFFANKYNIGYWAWELAKCPDEWLLVMDMVDEIWAPSRFIQQAFAEKTSKPVEYMPLCVTLPSIPEYKRAYFGLPEDAFLFLYTFDFFSYIDRKNPFAAIRAFKIAFPDRSTRVGLVIKVMNGNAKSAQWLRMLEMIGGDPRVFIFNQTMSREDVLGLFNVCDSFVSLHRSEGFGRGPAEAMYLGKPVIVTNYSGNTDFTLSDNSCLVNYQLIPVEPGQYVFERNQVWADADIAHAAWYMKKLASDSQYANEIGTRGKKFIHENFNSAAIGKIYAERLKYLSLAS